MKAIGINDQSYWNINNFFKILGVSSFKRKFGKFATSSVDISKNNNNWHIIQHIHLPLGFTVSSDLNCIDGVEFVNSQFVFLSSLINTNLT